MIEIRGTERLNLNIQAIINVLPSVIKKSIRRIVVLIEGTAKKLAAVDTGDMRRQIFSKVRGLVGFIISPVPYSAFVELGTRNQSAQPFMRPSIRRNITKSNRVLKEETERTFKAVIK